MTQGPSHAPLPVRAVQLGSRIEIRGLGGQDRVSTNPLGLEIASGSYAFLFRFGSAVFIGLTPEEQSVLIQEWAPHIIDPIEDGEFETTHIKIDPASNDGVTPEGDLTLRSLDLPRLLVLADALATSVALAQDEAKISRVLESMEPLSNTFQEKSAHARLRPRELRAQIGTALALQYRMVGRLEAGEKPEALWDHPQLEKFFARLVDEYELAERSRIIDRKITVMRDTAATLSDQLQTRHSLRLELYIVILIVIEIFLMLYELFLHD